MLDEIKLRAAQDWPDDDAMRWRCVRQEVAGYVRLQVLDFGALAHLKLAFVDSARRSFETWHEVACCVEMELQACCRLETLAIAGIAAEIVEAWKRQAREGGEGYYASQLEWVERQAREYLRLLRATG